MIHANTYQWTIIPVDIHSLFTRWETRVDKAGRFKPLEARHFAPRPSSVPTRDLDSFPHPTRVPSKSTHTSVIWNMASIPSARRHAWRCCSNLSRICAHCWRGWTKHAVFSSAFHSFQSNYLLVPSWRHLRLNGGQNDDVVLLGCDAL